MTCTLESIAPKCAAGCVQPTTRRRWAARAVGATLVALVIAFIEVKLIEHGIAADGGLVRVVDSSLASGFAPIAILR